MDRKAVIASLKTFMLVMVVVWLVLFSISLFFFDWAWLNALGFATALDVPIFLLGLFSWARGLSQSGIDLSIPLPFFPFKKWIKGWSGWQRILVLLSAVYSAYLSFWLMKDPIGVTGRLILFVVFFVVLALVSLFLLWFLSVLFKWVVAGFKNSGKSDER